MGIQSTAITNIILNRIARYLVKYVFGFLNSMIPQLILRGKEIMPNQVINVPKGTASSSSNVMFNKGEPVMSNITVNNITMSEL